MILFIPEHAGPILAGVKTQTRRLGKKRWREGAIHGCYTRPPFARGGAKPFCWVRIVRVRRQRLEEINEASARAEGYESVEKYREAWCRIYGAWYGGEYVWVVDFELVSVPL